MSLIPIKIGSFHKTISDKDLGRGFKLNIAEGKDTFKEHVFKKGQIEEQPSTTTDVISTIIKDSESLQDSMGIKGNLSVSYGPLISGEGSGNYLKSCMTTTKKVTLIYRSRHTAYFKRLQPGTLEPTQSANKMIH